MANLSRDELFLKISRNLLKEEFRYFKSFLGGSGVISEQFAENAANAYDICKQMEREKKLKPGELSPLTGILRKIGRQDYADLAEEVAENERKASNSQGKSADSFRSTEKEELESSAKRPRLAQYSDDGATATTSSERTLVYASSSHGPHYSDDDDKVEAPINVVVEKCTDEMLKTILREKDTYGMGKTPRGHVFILSNTKFPNQPHLPDRTGGDVDLINISKLMEGLSFEMDTVKEKTAQEIKYEVRRFTQRKDHISADCAVVVLMSHGKEDHIYGTDGQTVAMEDIFAMFDENSCLFLKGKPKLFFIQACRGDKVYRGQSSASEDDADSSYQTTDLDLGGELRRLLWGTSRGQDEAEAPQPEAEKRPHMFCGYATRPGYVSFRNRVDGSWFLQAITNVFMKDAKDKSLDEMKEKVKESLRTREANTSDPKYKGGKVEADFLSTLKKDLYFFPGQ